MLLEKKCVVTATTGKAAFNINGITIHSLLKLPISKISQKDLSGSSLESLQQDCCLWITLLLMNIPCWVKL